MISSDKLDTIERDDLSTHSDTQAFFSQIQQLRSNCDQLNNIDINDVITEIEQIGQQLKHSQEFLLKEIRYLKQELDINATKLTYADELRLIDQTTLNTFRTTFEDLTQALADVKAKETHAWQIVQMLRVNTSRLWQIFEMAIGTRVTDRDVDENLEKLLSLAQLEKNEQIECLVLLEKEHGDLLIKMKEIQMSLEKFRTLILQSTQNVNEMKRNIHKQQFTNDRMHEQSLRRVNHMMSNVKNVQTLLVDYKYLVNEIDNVLRLIFYNQTQIEMHQKTTLIFRAKLEKFKQDLLLKIAQRERHEYQIESLQDLIRQQNQNLKCLQNQKAEIIENRKKLHQSIDHLETTKSDILDNQQKLMDNIKMANTKKKALEREVFLSNQTLQNLERSCRNLSKDQNKQQNATDNLQKTIQLHDERLQETRAEINKFTEQIKQQDYQIDRDELQLDTKTKELHDLEKCLSTTYEQLGNQRSKVKESKIQVELLKQKLHKLKSDERPLAKEISHVQRQLIGNETDYIQQELIFKQNEAKINQYNSMIAKLTIDSKNNDRILLQENCSLGQFHRQKEQSKVTIKQMNKNLQSSESNYETLKQLFQEVENENRLLKRQYADCALLVRLVGQREATINSRLEPLYKTVKRLTNQYSDQMKTLAQSKSDLSLLNKYYLNLRDYNHRLHQAVLFQSQQHHEFVNSRNVSNQFTNFHDKLELEMKTSANHIHYWNLLMIAAPDQFNNISKLFLMKKKLVQKTNELTDLRRIFHEKEIVYRYLDQIYARRQRIYERMRKRYKL